MLLFQRKFFPFFITQFFGAFNDNLFKNAMLVFFSLTVASSSTLSLYTNLSMALFILPMFLFSAWSGLLAEQFEKRQLILAIKALEVLIMLLGVIAFVFEWPVLMMAILFLLGLQSAFFGPVKYGILPERLEKQELMLGNGLVEAGTFLAILLGTLLGAWLVSLTGQRYWLYLLMLSATAIGMIAAWFVPRFGKKQMQLSWRALPEFKPWKQTLSLLGYAYRKPVLFRSILAISWFWLLGGALLTQIPQFSKDVLGSNPEVTTYLLVLFSIGIGLGSLFASKLARGRIEPGLVPFGAFLLLGFLAWIVSCSGAPEVAVDELKSLSEFFHDPAFWPVTLAFAGTAFSGGIYVVPLYALLQHRTDEGHKSQMIAANNIVNSLFLVLISLISIVVLSVFHASMQTLFLILTVLHLGVSIYIFREVPEFILRFIALVLSRVLYRVRIKGRENFPMEGPALVICNHVTYMDPLIIMSACPRPIRFVMYYKIFNTPVINWVFKTAKAIPIAGRSENIATFNQAFKDVAEALQAGEVVGIFPEGGLTHDGEIAEFQRGVEYILKDNPVPVIPMVLDNLWGSFFSRYGGLFRGLPRKFMAKVTLQVGPSLSPASKAKEMEAVVRALKDPESGQTQSTQLVE